ncbi:MAG: ribonuclease Z [Patescibacteria group bacterium]|nr:ribonuclease Z [Patescibacteria group bacterium]
MQLTILGSGGPVSDLLKLRNRELPGYWVTWKGGHVLFEVSEGIRFRLQRIGVLYVSVKHIAVTHAHPDHYALPHFLEAVYCHKVFGGVKAEMMDVYAPDSIVDGWPALFKAFVPEAPSPDTHCTEEGYLWPKLTWHKMSGGKTVKQGDATLSAQNVNHGFGRCEAVAYRLETPEGVVAYSGDTADCPGIRAVAKDADLFLCEASAPVGSPAGSEFSVHLTPQQAGAVAAAARVKQLVLTHYYGLDSNKAMVADCRKSGFKGKIIIAKDFQEIKV